MPEGSGPAGPQPTDGGGAESGGEHIRPLATRRDFLVGAGVGAVAVGVVAGGGIALTRGGQTTTPVQTAPGGPAVAVPQPAAPAPAAQPQPTAQPAAAQPAAPAQTQASQLPATMRRVVLEIDGTKREAVVDVRESLWETMNHKLGMAASNLGCDRAQCGACTVLVDGRAVNGCTVLSARLGRGQQITTVAGLAKGPGVEGLHPVQRAFWQDGGFQCGICTRGFIMSTYALLTANPRPTDVQIAEGLSGNICRCGEYAKIYTAVNTAAAEMRGEQVNYLAPAAVLSAAPARPAAAAPAAASAPASTSKQFEFVTPFPTLEEFEPFAERVKERPGIQEVAGSERTVTVKWDSGRLDEAAVRRILGEAGRPVR